ncbi:MAG: 7-cyano-7-deazaguanine synthase QueC [Candidatus Omnitrophica bacterium]|nr:7-cyano-7-deazaguanine synthase QueC [Candidatus Omnitrophota bacterium]
MRRAIVLLSGGLDSSTTLFLARQKGYKASCLIFDYGQRHKKEIISAKKIAVAAKCKYNIIKIKLPWKGSSLLDKKSKLPDRRNIKGIPSTYVPARNLIFLSFALSFAESQKAQAIFIGANQIDYSGYPDCRKEFYQALKNVIRKGTKTGVEGSSVEILTPLINKTKSGIIKLGMNLGVPYQLTWSCYQGGRFPCGECDSCKFRAKGFKEARLKDPISAFVRQ